MRKLSLFTLLTATFFYAGCGSKSSDPAPAKVVKDFGTISMSTGAQVPEVAPDRKETGTATIKLYEDNTLEFSISVQSLSPSDELTVSHIHESTTLLEAGAILVGLVDNNTIKFNGTTASGKVKIEGANAADIINRLKTSNNLYVNAHSRAHPAGLLRGNMRKDIELAQNVHLSPTLVVPPVPGSRSERGVAMLRLVGTKLAYRIKIDKLTITNDRLTTARIHSPNTGSQNGNSFLELGDDNIRPFVVDKESGVATLSSEVSLTADQKSKLLNGDAYVLIRTTLLTNGFMRGNIE